MITVFTLCSVNYLAQAMTLGNSVIGHNPNCRFVIGLVDRLPGELASSLQVPYEVIPVEEIGIPAFAEMAGKYSIVELNTAVKPFFMEFFFRRDPSVEAVIYLDPDILVCGSFEPLAEKLRDCNLIVTPHSCSYDDSAINIFHEISMLISGIYNLGFLAAARSDVTFTFLKWWQKRLQDYCYYRGGSGMFVDQIWLTLAPLYFPGIYVEKDPGYNMCYWNHFERHLSRKDGRYLVNGRHPLVFYHFSSYDPMKPDVITKRPETAVASFLERPDLRPIYDDYRSRLLANNYDQISALKCAFGRKPPSQSAQVKTAVRIAVREIINCFPAGLRKPVKWLGRWLRGAPAPEFSKVNPYVRNV